MFETLLSSFIQISSKFANVFQRNTLLWKNLRSSTRNTIAPLFNSPMYSRCTRVMLLMATHSPNLGSGLIDSSNWLRPLCVNMELIARVALSIVWSRAVGLRTVFPRITAGKGTNLQKKFRGDDGERCHGNTGNEVKSNGNTNGCTFYQHKLCIGLHRYPGRS